jgi:hypothetical protein
VQFSDAVHLLTYILLRSGQFIAIEFTLNIFGVVVSERIKIPTSR